MYFEKNFQQPMRMHLDPMAVRQFNMATYFLEYIGWTSGRVHLSWIDFFLDCVRRDLQADIQHNPFSALTGNFDATPFPFQYFDAKEESSFTYKQIRFEQQEGNHLSLLQIPIEMQWLDDLTRKNKQTMPQILVYEPLQIALVLSKKTPKAEWLSAAVIDLSALFPHVTTNGYHWQSTYTRTTLDGQMPDFRIAVLYEGAHYRAKFQERLHTLENGEEKM